MIISTPVKSLIDPTASVINRHSSTRSLKLIHRALLSHLFSLDYSRSALNESGIEEETFEVEYDSTVQLLSDLGICITRRQHA